MSEEDEAPKQSTYAIRRSEYVWTLRRKVIAAVLVLALGLLAMITAQLIHSRPLASQTSRDQTRPASR